jgi:hypothetical protein
MATLKPRQRKYALELPIQFFAEGGQDKPGGTDVPGASGQGSNDDNPPTGAKGDPDGGTGITPAQQAEIDRVRNQYSHENKKLQESIEQMQATIRQLQDSGKSKEQLAQEAEERLKKGESELLKSKNEFHAARQLANAKLGSDLLEFVVVNEGDNEEARNSATDLRLKKLQDVINAEVKSQVEAKFKAAGYNPGQATGDDQPSKPRSTRAIAEKHRIIK